MRRMRIAYLTTLAILLTPLAASADPIVIDNRAAAQNEFQCFGASMASPCARVFGQSFTVLDQGTYLNRFGFDMMPILSGPMKIRFRLHEFTGSGFIASELFSSSVVTLTHRQRTFVDFAVGVDLIAGRRYMGYLDAMVDYSDPSRSGLYTDLSQGGYSGGAGSYYRHGDDAWLFFNRGDFGFRAEFSESYAVPEPGTFALFGIGLAAIGLAGRRRKTWPNKI